jgi:hypothetical protein
MRKTALIIHFILIGMFVTALNVFSQTVTPIAHWSFNENNGTSVVDSKSGFTGELIGETSFDSSEKVEGSSLVFNGTTDYVQTDLLAAIQEAENITLMAWFNTNAITGAPQNIFWIGDVTGNGWGAQQELHLTINHFNADLQNSNVCLFYGSSADTGPNNVNIVSSDATFVEGEWHHIAGVIKNMSGLDGATEAELYLDGVLITPLDWTTTTYGFANSNIAGDIIDRSTWDSPLRIGTNGVITRAFNGFIDEVMIYDQALTKEEIEIAMNNVTANHQLKNEIEGNVYPSIIKDVLRIKNSEIINSVEIIDVAGKTILSTSIKSDIDVSRLNKGIYFVKINGKSGSRIQKIVKQ